MRFTTLQRILQMANVPTTTSLDRSVVTIEDAARLAFASDGKRLLSVTDPFGSSRISSWMPHRCFNERNINENSESGGAGLGLFFVFK